MNEKLIIDPEFKAIIPPLTELERENLEESLRHEGCRDAIVTWNDVIVDGHNRYEICRKWNIPYRTIRISFPSREAAVSWICMNQLSRRNLSQEAVRYLIGKHYNAQKILCRNPDGNNRFTDRKELTGNPETWISGRTSKKIAEEFNLTHTTIERFGQYSRSVDRIEEERPGSLPILLSGRVRISRENLSTLSKMPGKDIVTFMDQVESNGKKKGIPLTLSSAKIAEIIGKSDPAGAVPAEKLDTRIKEMPEYSPDDEINGLLYTVPSWVGMIQRLRGTPARYASQEAREKMYDALSELQDAAAELQKELEENR